MSKSTKKLKMIKSPASDSDGESRNELWAPVAEDILTGTASSKLTAADYASLCGACKSWPTAFSSVPASRHPHTLPFLLLPPHYTLPDPLCLRSPLPPFSDYPLGPIVRFPFSLDRRYIDSPIFPLGSLRNPAFCSHPFLPKTAHHVCIGSSHGWLILLGPTSHISLLNPLTAATIPLPSPLTSVRYFFPVSDDRDIDRYLLSPPHQPRRLLHLATLIRLAALSADPSTDPSFLLVIVLGNDNISRFLTCVPSDGDAAWKPHIKLRFPAYGLTDLIFHHGRCFAAITWHFSGDLLVGPVNAIAVFNFHTLPAFQGLFNIHQICENYPADNYANFLIESAGEVLVVTRHGEITAGHFLVNRLPPLEGDGPFVPTPLASLGDQALFLGMGNSVLVQAMDFLRFIQRNSIYFTDVYRKVVDGRAVSVGCVYVFDMEQGVTRKAFEVAEEHEMNMWSNLRPWWVMPNLRGRDP